MKKKILIGVVIVLVGIQFIRIDKTNPPVDASKDFMTITDPPEEVEKLIRTSCYDCHSNESTYPWYSNIAPVSWWVKDHINEAREELNFSEWGTYEWKRTDHKLEECAEEVDEVEMPLKSYLIAHSEARLSDEDRAKLVDWFLYVRLKNKPVAE
jgi:hypothetical protein